MKVTALLTGRGNNTLKDKNILDILGHPAFSPRNWRPGRDPWRDCKVNRYILL